MHIRIGIYGYGNLGRGVESAIRQNEDMELAAVFTRRDPAALQIATPGVPVYRAQEAAAHREEIDVLILCGGSATDLPVQTPEMAQYFKAICSTRMLCSRMRAKEFYHIVGPLLRCCTW